jgi:hypothetical protein
MLGSLHGVVWPTTVGGRGCLSSATDALLLPRSSNLILIKEKSHYLFLFMYRLSN